MARRLIVDTGVLVASERGRADLRSALATDDDLVVAAVTVAELRAGVELGGEKHRAARSAFVLKVLETLPVLPYDLATAEAHGRLLAHVHRAGSPRGAHDLIIAATAAASRRTILTTDRSARFDQLPGVACLVVEG